MEIRVMKKIVTSLLLAVSLGVLGGCATVSKEEFQAVKATADKAAADAAAAKSAADKAAAAAAKAQASADAAKSTADAAKTSADAAKSAADVANACCQDTQTKIDRMFKKSMYK
jgi:Alanine-zipper, major outer membrane lipoprotein